MTQMNISTKQKQTLWRTDCDCQGEGIGEGKNGSLGLAEANYYL